MLPKLCLLSICCILLLVRPYWLLFDLLAIPGRYQNALDRITLQKFFLQRIALLLSIYEMYLTISRSRVSSLFR